MARAKSFVPLKRVSGPVIPLSSSPKAEKALSVGSGTAISCAYSCYLSVLMSTIISTKVKSTATMEAPATPAGSNSVDGLTCDCTSSFQNQEYCLHCDRAAHVGLQVLEDNFCATFSICGNNCAVGWNRSIQRSDTT